MITIIKGNENYIDGVMNLYYRLQSDFKEKNLDIYQDNEYPNRDIFVSDLSKSDNTLLILDNDKVIGFITSENGDKFIASLFDDKVVEEKFFEKYKLKDYKGRMVAYERLMIDPDYRHQGYGSKLMSILSEKYSGYFVIFLAHKDNHNAIKLYEYLGYNCLGLEEFCFGKYYVFAKNQLVGLNA